MAELKNALVTGAAKRLGRAIALRGPGLVIIIPIVDRVVYVDLRELFLEILDEPRFGSGRYTTAYLEDARGALPSLAEQVA